uniref:NADH-ubiquinone oxidoreductase chain 4L n=1 Tax=Anadara consociata TaxID=2592665 RepID=A0A7D0GHZ5_9BIVA|nr:NADH dehydrogenase subunit 4L [Anadara sp. SS-2018]QDH82324.1 NADH dehydrogenase subunit 4L [Anadara consociata]
MFFGGFLSMLENKHVLSIMVSVEFLFLAAVWVASSTVGIYDMTPILILLVLGVCEAALMLSVLVRMVRGFGNDLVLGLGVLSC